MIFQAVRYSLLAGGKRLRPILCLAAAEAVGGKAGAILPVACALEFIHTYSLIHDDLPAMDNDDYRRGKLTSHKVFGEDIAILAGDALLTEAFHLLTRRDLMPGIPPERLLDVTARDLRRRRAGSGWSEARSSTSARKGKTVDLETLQQIHRLKTGAMIRVSLRAGAILSGASDAALASLSDYGRQIGLAFQIADDILNVEGDRDPFRARRREATRPGERSPFPPSWGSRRRAPGRRRSSGRPSPRWPLSTSGRHRSA